MWKWQVKVFKGHLFVNVSNPNASGHVQIPLHTLVINFTVSCEPAQNVNKRDVTASILQIEDLHKVGHLHMRECAGLHQLLHTHAQYM